MDVPELGYAANTKRVTAITTLGALWLTAGVLNMNATKLSTVIITRPSVVLLPAELCDAVVVVV